MKMIICALTVTFVLGAAGAASASAPRPYDSEFYAFSGGANPYGTVQTQGHFNYSDPDHRDTLTGGPSGGLSDRN